MSEEINVLHIDYEDDSTVLNSDILESKNQNITITTVQDPDLVIKNIENSYNAIISGYKIPDTNGIELLKQIRRKDQNIPFILFTGEGSEEVASQSISANVTEYIQKTGGEEQYDRIAETLQATVEKYENIQEMNTQTKDQYDNLIEDLRKLYAITSDRDISFEDRLNRLLERGAKHFGFETAFVGKVESGKLRIVESYTKHEKLQKGSTCSMNDTYCQETLKSDTDFLVINDPSSYWTANTNNKKTPYDLFGLEEYIGAKIKINNEIYGTLCFATETELDREITHSDRAVVEVMARWLTYELEQARQKNNLEDANQKLSRFAEIVSHDIRNPLNVAIGRLDFERSERDSEHLEKVDSSLERIESIIERVLMVSKNFELDETDYINLDEIVEESWNNVQTNDMNIIRNIDPEIEIKADKERIKQVFENMFRNAEEHGGNTVTVGRLENGFFIEDNGDGIEDEKIGKMFDYGYTTGGTGLGLYIVQEVVEDHEWNITAKSENGARFEITNVQMKQ